MIKNLNQMSFQEYGNVVTERSSAFDNITPLHLIQGDVTVCKAVSDIWINCSQGMSILHVSRDGENFEHFYLDKPALLKKGMYYALDPFKGNATVQFSANAEPEALGKRPSDSLRVEPSFRIDGFYTFFYQEREPGFLFSGEAHPMYELTYVDQGALHSVVDGKDTLLQKGDLVLYGPNQWHMQYADIDVAPRFVTITFDLSGRQPDSLLNRKIAVSQHTVTLLHRMLREQEQEVSDDFSNDVILSHLKLLLLLLLRDDAQPRQSRLQTSNAILSENEIIRQAQQYVASHIREKLTVPLVARQVDVSPSYLTALFHKNLQISPGEYIRRIKLQESKQMIRENDLNFTEIAAALQYSTVHHFSRQFKDKFGITPTEYAKSVR